MTTIWVYGARDSRTRSGAPFYFMQHLARQASGTAFSVAGIPLVRISEAPLAFARWALKNRNLSSGRYLFTQDYHDTSFAKTGVRVKPGDVVISFTQILPRALLDRDDITLYSYFDVTLSEFCGRFWPSRASEEDLTSAIVAREKHVYRQVQRLFVYTPETKASLTADYNVRADRITVLGRGANVPLDLRASRTRAGSEKLNLMIVGIDAARKGMNTLIAAIDALPPANQERIILTLAGPRRWSVPRRKYIRALGYMGPNQREKLLARMARADLGVLLSTADALPSSVFEFLTLGVPIWTTDLPGMREALAGHPAYFETLPIEVEHVRSRLLSWTERPSLVRDAINSQSANADALSWSSRAARVLATIEAEQSLPASTGVVAISDGVI
ncbi:MAG: glycosyltransferase [Alphaproteobacteria bacterium]